MGFYSRSYCRLRPDQQPEEAIALLSSTAAAIPGEHHHSLRFRFHSQAPWIMVDNLGIWSLTDSDDAHARSVLMALIAAFPHEWISFNVVSASSCASYFHSIDGSTRRFLCGVDGVWAAIYGEPEEWEDRLLSKEFEWTYQQGGESPFWDSTVPAIARDVGLPGFDQADSLNYWTIDAPLDVKCWPEPPK